MGVPNSMCKNSGRTPGTPLGPTTWTASTWCFMPQKGKSTIPWLDNHCSPRWFLVRLVRVFKSGGTRTRPRCLHRRVFPHSIWGPTPQHHIHEVVQQQLDKVRRLHKESPMASSAPLSSRFCPIDMAPPSTNMAGGPSIIQLSSSCIQPCAPGASRRPRG